MFVYRSQVRFEDVDYAQVVFYPRFFQYAHNAFEAFFGEALGVSYHRVLRERRLGFPTVHAEADFVRPLRFGDGFEIAMETLELGTSSIRNHYEFRCDAEVAARLVVVTACTDLDRFVAAPLPADLRDGFRAHLRG